jgi:hypothetical protein
MHNKPLNRRSFVKVAASSLAALPIVLAAADSVEKLDESAAQAVGLGYRHDSTAVAADKYPNHQSTQICGGCSLYANNLDGWGDCAIFPGKKVAEAGWCAAFAAKAS